MISFSPIRRCRSSISSPSGGSWPPRFRIPRAFPHARPSTISLTRPRDPCDRPQVNLEELDGRIGEGWGGVSPNGAHLNVVLARRGSPTAAAAVGMLAHPSPGHTPVLVCVGPDQE